MLSIPVFPFLSFSHTSLSQTNPHLKTLTHSTTHSHTCSPSLIETHYTSQHSATYPINSHNLPHRVPVYSVIRLFKIHECYPYLFSLFFHFLTHLSQHKNLIRTSSTFPKPTLLFH